jgi:hypothetical protein
LFPIIFVHLGNNIMVMLVFGNKLLYNNVVLAMTIPI